MAGRSMKTLSKNHFGQAWWHTPLIPALRMQRQGNLCEFEASLVYSASSRTARATQRNFVSRNQKTDKQTSKNHVLKKQRS